MPDPGTMPGEDIGPDPDSIAQVNAAINQGYNYNDISSYNESQGMDAPPRPSLDAIVNGNTSEPGDWLAAGGAPPTDQQWRGFNNTVGDDVSQYEQATAVNGPPISQSAANAGEAIGVTAETPTISNLGSPGMVPASPAIPGEGPNTAPAFQSDRGANANNGNPLPAGVNGGYDDQGNWHSFTNIGRDI